MKDYRVPAFEPSQDISIMNLLCE